MVKVQTTTHTKEVLAHNKWLEIQNRKDPFYTIPIYIKYGILIGWGLGISSIMLGYALRGLA